jgi:predicted RNA-binding protein with PIN domain
VRAKASAASDEPAPGIGRHEAIQIARRDPKVILTRERYGQLSPSAERKPPNWQVGFFEGGSERVQVLVDSQSGEVRESWTGYQVAWQMARGYPGLFGHKLNAPYVWIPLCALFLLGLVEWRRPWRWVHLDLLVLLSFGISHIFFNQGNIGVSVPLTYPPLAYLLGRMLWVGFKGAGRGLRPSAPATWLAIATVFLIAFRIALNIADSGVIDVGYAGVIGADHMTHGHAVWGSGVFPSDNQYGDTYGPANYFAYVPFELALPWSGSWDNLPAAHAAAIAFDLAVLILLFLCGRRLRPGRAGRDLGVVLAFAWAAYPYSDFALQSNSNDSLMAALLMAAVLAISSPAGRGAFTALASAAKFAPLGVAPLFATAQEGLVERLRGGVRWPSVRPVAVFVLAFAAVAALMLVYPLIDSGLATLWTRTIHSQIDRTSPFSIWGQTDLDRLHLVVDAAAVGIAILVALVPRRRTVAQVAALAAAVMIAIEITADHWFYLYIPWFFPLLLVGLTGMARAGRDPADEKSARRLLIDGMNLIGSRPDGWWKDRPKAMQALLDELERYTTATGQEVGVVFDGRPLELDQPADARVRVAFARRRGPDAADDEITRMVAADSREPRLNVVTSDKRLANRVRRRGAETITSGAFRRELEELQDG